MNSPEATVEEVIIIAIVGGCAWKDVGTSGREEGCSSSTLRCWQERAAGALEAALARTLDPGVAPRRGSPSERRGWARHG